MGLWKYPGVAVWKRNVVMNMHYDNSFSLPSLKDVMRINLACQKLK